MGSQGHESLSSRMRRAVPLRTSPSPEWARPTGGPPQASSLVRVAFGPSAVALLVVVVLGSLTLISEGSDLDGILAQFAALWLGVHQVPVTVSAVTISVLPLLPTGLLIALVARGVRRALEHQARADVLAALTVIACAISGPLVWVAIALAIIDDASKQITIENPSALLTFGLVAAVHAIGAGIGAALAWKSELAELLALPRWAVTAIAQAATALRMLFITAAILVGVQLLVHIGQVVDLVKTGNDFAGMVGLVIISILYLPNVVVGAGALVVGANTHVGAATVGLATSAPGDLPAVPVLAAVPVNEIPVYALVLLVIPVAIAITVGRRCAQLGTDLVPTAQAVLGAAVLTGVGVAGIAWAAGGSLGFFGFVGADAVISGVFATGWIAVIGLIAAVIAQQFGETVTVRQLRREREAFFADDEEPVTATAAAPVEIEADGDVDVVDEREVADEKDPAVEIGAGVIDAAADLKATDELETAGAKTAPTAKPRVAPRRTAPRVRIVADEISVDGVDVSGTRDRPLADDALGSADAAALDEYTFPGR